MPIVRNFRPLWAALLAALVLIGQPVCADQRDDFHAALETAAARCRLALQILETEGQGETSAAVQNFRQAWQQVMMHYRAINESTVAEDAATFLDVDVRTIGVLLVIDLGNRDAARTALEAIEDIVTELAARPLPPTR